MAARGGACVAAAAALLLLLLAAAGAGGVHCLRSSEFFALVPSLLLHFHLSVMVLGESASARLRLEWFDRSVTACVCVCGR